VIVSKVLELFDEKFKKSHAQFGTLLLVLQGKV